MINLAPTSKVLFPPNPVRQFGPPCGIGIHPFFVNGVDLLRAGMGKASPCFCNHLAHHVGIVDDHARPQMVRVVGLTGSDVLEERTVQCFFQGLFFDIIHGDMSIDAGFHVSLGVDVEVAAGARNAPVHVRAVIPEVQDKDGARIPDEQDLTPEMVSLFRSHHQRKVCLAIDRKIEKIHLRH